MTDKLFWKGVLIKESLNTKAMIPEIQVIDTRVTTLEEEKEKGIFHFHNVEVLQEYLDKVTQFISQNIKDSWYFHLVKGDEMVVVFRNKIFLAKKDQQETIDTIRDYALIQGIIEAQLPLEKLFENPYI